MKNIAIKYRFALVIIVSFGLCSIPLSSNAMVVIDSSNDFIFESIDMDIARTVAQKKIIEIDNVGGFQIDSCISICNSNKDVLCFIFELTPQGYIVVSSSYDLPPVIAYSFTNNYDNNIDDTNILVDLLKADLDLRLEYIDEISQDVIEKWHNEWREYLQPSIDYLLLDDFQQWPPEGTTDTGGWVETLWHQSAPYNDMVPIDKESGDKSVAGCPSITMGQILDYHKTVPHPMFNDSDDYNHNYAGNLYKIDDDHVEYEFPSFPELNSYLTTLIDHYENEIEPTDSDIAALIFACGVACHQVYNPAGSGTFGVNQAYDAYTRFNIDTELLDSDDTDVYGRLQMNIIDGYPAHLAVVNDAWTVGHNLVVDGYNTDGFYHLNFGWGGSYNGWYHLPEDLPMELTVLEGIVLDIFYEPVGSDIYCEGNLHWVNITEGETLTGSFIVKNLGETGSLLNWEITSYPDWGEWTFTPTSGIDLSTEDEPTTVEITLVAPAKKILPYSGYIEISNTDNSDDVFIIQVSLATPKNVVLISRLQHLFNNNPVIYSIIKSIMNL